MNFPGSLHNHTHISNLRLRDSTNKEEALIDYAIKLGHSVIAFTEHEALCNAVKIEKYYEKIKPQNPNFKVVRGNEIYLCRNGLDASNFERGVDRYWHFILLAKDAKGHEQIRELSSRAWLRSYSHNAMTRVPTYYSDLEEIIGKEPGHVIGSTACLGGFLPSKILQYYSISHEDNFYDKILHWCVSMQQIFGNKDFYLEMQPSENQEQVLVNNEMIKISSRLNIPYIITTDSHYLKKEDRPIHKAFLTSQSGEREVDEFYASTYMMDTKELESYFGYFDKKILDRAYTTIEEIKNKCEDYNLRRPLVIPSLSWKEPPVTAISADSKWFDRIPMLKTFYLSSFDGDRVLARAVVSKLESDARLQTEEIYRELDSNLDITWRSSEKNNTHWSAYFLNLQKILEVCWEAGTLVGPGRGSGVGFLLLYILDVIQINPLWEKTKCYSWRFLNPERVSVLDIDTDIEGGRRAKVLEALREYYGRDRVANVVTFGTESSKAAIQTAARGLGIDVDTAYYLSSLVPADRGKTRTLSECFYGNKEKDFKPIPAFVHAMKEEYPELWEVARNIEGLISRVGEHAGGVIFVDEPFSRSTALMKVPNGDVVTQFDLHDCEDCSLIKIDLLSVEALDKIHNCLDLLVNQGYIKPGTSLKETYENTIGVYRLERKDLKMWQMIWNHDIHSLFQMEKQSGIQGISLIKPRNINDLTVLNSVIRLMASEKGGEQPLNMWARYRANINQWYDEMRRYGLTQEEISWLANHDAVTDGICESQEGLMLLVQEDKLGGNSLTFADKCRKGIAKKQGKLFEECEQAYYKNASEKGCSDKLVHYVWDVLLAPQRGYSFNRSHCLAYSLVGLQEMNLCFKYPIIFWNCACLITDSGGTDKGTDYAKMAQAMGKMINSGVKISLCDINKSDYAFIPEVSSNKILYGLKGVTTVNNDLIKEIIEHRPYVSMQDFLNKVNVNKQAMIALIKGGAFDEFYDTRYRAMVEYIWMTCDKKKRLTLQNMPGLIRNGLLPEDTEEQITARRIYEFNRYLKAECKNGENYRLTTRAIDFLSELGGFDEPAAAGQLSVKAWDKFYQGWMDVFRNWIKSDTEGILDKLNTKIFMADWEKYAKGTLSSWEMEALCFYYHDHELKNVNKTKYGIVNYSDLPEEPEVEKFFKRGNSQIPIYKLNVICGTAIAKDKTKHTVYLLTEDDVVAVKFNSEHFALFDKQVSRRNPDGTRTVVEKSWFNRGNKLLIQGIRQGDQFRTKKYASSKLHQLYHIDEIKDNGDLVLRSERYDGEQEEED